MLEQRLDDSRRYEVCDFRIYFAAKKGGHALEEVI
jgi:hypothetical protein